MKRLAAAEKARISADKATKDMWEEWQKTMVNTAHEYGDFLVNKIDSIMEAYSGGMSYLSSDEKGSYLATLEGVIVQAGESAVSIMEKKLESNKSTATTKEEYIPMFDAYIRVLQSQEPEKTLDDLEDTLEAILEQNKRLELVMNRTSYQSPIY